MTPKQYYAPEVPFAYLCRAMKLYIIAGEASGDLHGSNLIKALRNLQPDVSCRVWGGDLMAAAGGQLVKHYRDLAFMGFVEVLANLRTILSNIRFCQKDIQDYQPDAVVLIDYPGFNLRMAKWLRREVAAGRLKTKIIYYISPQIWAWHQSRVHAIRRDVDEMLVILPFEPAFYQKHHTKATFVGHPLLDVLPAPLNVAPEPDLIALLPGSRRQELTRILPKMLSVVDRFPAYRFAIAVSSALPKSLYEDLIQGHERVVLVEGDTYGLLAKARAALVKSGTSTLETALIGTPQVVCYTGNRVSFAIAKRIVDIKYISLVNLIADAPVVTELIQDDLNTERIAAELHRILDTEVAASMRQQYAQIRALLGNAGASERAAAVILRAVNG